MPETPFDLNEYQRLVREIDAEKREEARADGAKRTLLAQLEKEFGCSTEEEGKAQLTAMERENDNAVVAFRKALDKYNREVNRDDVGSVVRK